MKLKSKLIATIVSMCAAIAVMGVGVWASSSQHFQITVKNDIDVKIISVDADVYGEFAVYSQFSGHSAKGITNAYAQAYHASRGQVSSTFVDRNNMDHGYLLYSSALNGYNDGYGNSDAKYLNDNANWDYNNVDALPTSGYAKYTNEAKEGVYFATAESDGISDSVWKNADDWAQDVYNIDYTTRTAQITYMYTIRQWKMASANAASNGMDLLLQSSISYKEDADINNEQDDSSASLGEAIYNAAGTAGIYINAYITNASEAENLGAGNAYNTPAQGAANGVGKTADTLVWRKMDLQGAYSLPDSVSNETYYIVLTYTFARTGANLDLSGLQNAVEHSLILTPAGKLEEFSGQNKTITGYNDITPDKNTMLCYATGVHDSNSGTDYQYAGGGYQVYGKEFVPKFSPAQITSQLTQSQLASCFALYDTQHGTEGYGSFAKDYGTLTNYQNQAGKNMPNHSNILLATFEDGKQTTNPDSIDRAGYIFESPISKANIVKDADNENAFYPDMAVGTTAYYVKQFNDGNPVGIVSHSDSINGPVYTNPSGALSD